MERIVSVIINNLLLICYLHILHTKKNFKKIEHETQYIAKNIILAVIIIQMRKILYLNEF